MNPLQRSSLGIEIDEVLATSDTVPSLFAGHDQLGRQYLVARTVANERSATWLCAPISQLALRCVAEGRAAPSDALRHSSTGTVQKVTVSTDDRQAVEESVQMCGELRDEDLTGAGVGIRLPRVTARAS